MIEKMYFTPSPEDIRIGFEYERAECYNCPRWDPSPVVDSWRKEWVISYGDMDRDWGYLTHFNRVRVPYLTDEQVIEEGWEDGRKGEWNIQLITILEDDKDPRIHLVLSRELDDSGYSGPCKDINQFRQICKFLHI